MSGAPFTPSDFLCACVLNWIGTALDKEPHLLLLGKTNRVISSPAVYGLRIIIIVELRRLSEAQHVYLRSLCCSQISLSAVSFLPLALRRSWRSSTTCLRSRLTWRRLSGRSCTVPRRCSSVSAALFSCWKTSSRRYRFLLTLRCVCKTNSF